MEVSSRLPRRNLREGKQEKGVSFCLLLRDGASACDSQSVHLGAVEGAARHLLDAISGEPSVSRKRSQVRGRKLRDTSVFLGHRLQSFDSFQGFKCG